MNRDDLSCDIKGCEDTYTAEIYHNISLGIPIHFNLCVKHDMEFTKNREDDPFCVPKGLNLEGGIIDE